MPKKSEHTIKRKSFLMKSGWEEGPQLMSPCCDDDIVADDDDNDDDNNDNDDYLHCAGLDLFPEGSTRRYQVHQSGDVHQACGG